MQRENNMTLELTRTERRLLLQGIWKEADMYAKMKVESKDDTVVLHACCMLKTLDELEHKILDF